MNGRNNMQGVWTDADDDAIRASKNSVEYHRTLAKHGEERCAARILYVAVDTWEWTYIVFYNNIS